MIHIPAETYKPVNLAFFFEGEEYHQTDLVVMEDRDFLDLFNRVVDRGCDLQFELDRLIELEAQVSADKVEDHARQKLQLQGALDVNSIALDLIEQEYERRDERQCQNCLRLFFNTTEFNYTICPECRTGGA